MPRISSPRPLDLTKPFLTSSQTYGSQPFDLSQKLVTWYRDIQGDFVPDLSGRGNTARRSGRLDFQPVTASSDTPEFNSNVYGIKSFGLGLGSTSTSISHITTSGSIAGNVSIDHSFTDGTQDFPFSISFWIKPDRVTGPQVIISKHASPGHREWYAFMSNQLLVFDIIGDGGSNIDRVYKTVFTAGNWHHIVITYDGSYEGAGIKFYLNGSELSSLTYQTFGSGYSISNRMIVTDAPLCIGTTITNLANSNVSTSEFDGSIHSVAIWKDRQLGSSEISALYNAYVNGPGGEVRSGFISRSPRLQLRELDDLPGAYSTVRRTGDPTRAGALTSNFNDETTIIFSESGESVFPSMLPKGSAFSSQAVDIIGQESDISVSLPVRSFQQPTHLHYSPTENVGPFDENRSSPASSFFLNGTDARVLPGFQSPLRSKASFTIDITPKTDTKFTRNMADRNVSEGQPQSPTNSGFMYYNFARREWEQIGINDPATGSPLYYDYDLSFNNSMGGEAPSGTLPAQFSVSPARAYAPDSEKQFLGYSKIGTPVSAFGAPNAEMYHATSSQCLKMSDFISDPFLLEAARVEISEARALRIQGDSFVGTGDDEQSGYSGLFQSGSIRDIDNYVFFMYRQSRKNRVIDSVADVSSSERYLILSGAMTFWNSASFESNRLRYEGQEINFGLTHTPAFSYEFGLPYSSSFDTRLLDWDPSHDTYYVNNTLFDVTSNCVAHFNFETTKSELEQEPDKTGNGHVATIGVGGVTVDGPEFGDYPTTHVLDYSFFNAGAYITNRGCLNLETDGMAVNDIMTIDHATDLQMSRSSGLAIAFWMKPKESALGAEQWIITKSDMFSDVEYSVSLDPSDHLEFRVYDSTSTGHINNYIGIRTTTAITSGWYHVVVSYSGGFTATSLVISIDGVAVPYVATTDGGVDTPSFSPRNLSAPVRVGALGGNPAVVLDFQGKIGSLEFYNTHVLSTAANKLYLLQETPFLNDPEFHIGQFTGSIDMQLKPAVCNRQSFGVSSYSSNDLQNVWLGGTSFKKFKEDSWAVHNFYPANPFEIENAGGPGPGPYEGKPIDDSRFSAAVDPRASRFFGLDSSDPSAPTQQTVSNVFVINDQSEQGTPSPYLLMPEDEIIFGMDAGICSLWFLDSGNFSHLTGSHFAISPKTCKITLYGSLVKQNSENSISLNQDLSSNSVHEIIGAEPQLDQFQIEPISSYYGSYVDEIVAGDMAKPALGGLIFSITDQDSSRRVVSRVSLGQAGTTGSIQRFVNLVDGSERTYDSCLPDAHVFLEDTDNFIYVPDFKPGLAGAEAIDRLEFGITSPIETNYFFANQFPFQFNPSRKIINRKSSMISTTVFWASDDPVVRSALELTGTVNDILFRTRYTNVNLPYYGLTLNHRDSTRPKAAAYRYGISNITPEFTSSRWRYDRYGQLRDMLEPRLLTARYGGFNPVKVRFMSGSQVLSDPTETHSQNINNFATSSLPFFDDGIARNREDNPDDMLVNVFSIIT